jgi:iron complex outermembrane recepter protein
VSTGGGKSVLRLRRPSLAGGGVFLVFLLSSPQAWSRTPQAWQQPQTQQDPPARQATQDASFPQKDLTSTSIEDLMNVEVTSASKKEQKLSKVAAAIFVITQEDIRRSGATNIPDLLRMVPGMDVAQIDGSTWAIGSRGFNQQFSNKLLVLVDGRSVYSQTFSGVFWDTLDIPLFDIERIEVIRGPGGTIWGANAVSGVISIFTKKAAETKGMLVETGGGTTEQGFGTVQYGASAGKNTDFRVYANYFNQSHLLDLGGQSGADGWHRLRSGFRMDSSLSPKDSLMFEGDVSVGREGEFGFELPSVTSLGFVPVAEEISLADGSLETVWNHTYSDTSNSSLQFSYAQHRRDDPLNPELRNTYDLDYNHQFSWGSRQEIVWGLGYRYTNDRIGGSLTVAMNPPNRALQLFDSFVQDEIAIVPERLFLTVGSKLEHNDYTGFEVMPNVRASWSLSDHHMIWVAVSRALRAPSRNDTNLVLNIGSSPGPGGMPILLRLLGNPQFQDEQLIAYEAGYRTMISKRFSIDLAAYFNDWSHVQSTEPSGTFFESGPAPAHEVQTLTYENLIHGENHGFEIVGNLKVTDRWSISMGYAPEEAHMHADPSSADTETVPFLQGATPNWPIQLRSHVDLRRDLAWDVSTYFLDALDNQGPLGNVRIASYTRLDTQITWKVAEQCSVSLVGQNLLKDHHMEFEDVNGSMQSSEIKRSAYAKITWQF